MSVEARSREVATNTGRRRRGIGWAESGLAIAGLVIGVGIGVRGLGVGAGGWRVAAGLVALAAGIALAGLGMARLIAGLRPVWRVLGGVVYTIVLALIVWTLTPAVIATFVPPIVHGAATPQEFGMEAEEVVFTSEDGVDLWGWYVPSRNGSAVVLRHGSGSTATSVLPHARVLAGHGYGVLMTDARGHGNSSGRAMDFGWFGDLDIGAAVNFLVERSDVDPGRIAVVGLSMGGEEAIGAIGVDSRISAVVAEGASARTDADKTWLSDVYGWRGWVQQRLEWLQYSFTDMLTSAAKPKTLAGSAQVASPRQILLIIGGDVSYEVNAAAHIMAGAGNVSAWTVPGAGHVQGLVVAPEDWERVVVGFLENALEAS